MYLGGNKYTIFSFARAVAVLISYERRVQCCKLFEHFSNQNIRKRESTSQLWNTSETNCHDDLNHRLVLVSSKKSRGDQTLGSWSTVCWVSSAERTMSASAPREGIRKALANTTLADLDMLTTLGRQIPKVCLLTLVRYGNIWKSEIMLWSQNTKALCC